MKRSTADMATCDVAADLAAHRVIFGDARMETQETPPADDKAQQPTSQAGQGPRGRGREVEGPGAHEDVAKANADKAKRLDELGTPRNTAAGRSRSDANVWARRRDRLARTLSTRVRVGRRNRR